MGSIYGLDQAVTTAIASIALMLIVDVGDCVGLKLHLGLSQFLGSVGKLWLSYSVSAYSFINRAVMASLIGMVLNSCSLTPQHTQHSMFLTSIHAYHCSLQE